MAAKFLTKRALNVEAIGRTFKPLWRAKKDFKVREVGDHILLFVFELEADAEWVLANEPWTFDKHIVLLQRFDGSTPPRYLRFTKLKFWVQIYGLLISLLDPETTMELGESLGQVTPCENPNELVGGIFYVFMWRSMCQNPSAEVGKSHWMITMNDGFHSNTKSSQISVTGAA